MPYKDPDKRREAARIATAKWRANHPDRAKESNRLHDARRSEKRKQYKRAMEKARYWENPELEREQARKRRYDKPEVNRAYKLRKNYGISLEQYQAMFEEQNGCCAACHLPPEEGRMLVIDHNHDTGEVRGLLHNNCNVIVGMTREDSSLLFHLAEYMEKHHG
ncbi:MAG TPA: endonuclease domain-containing protein [Ktedonobacteraceae bacterium]|nr:endonuclease domain-containing protein [Ktedonobacteraceae bacterium]